MPRVTGRLLNEKSAGLRGLGAAWFWKKTSTPASTAPAPRPPASRGGSGYAPMGQVLVRARRPAGERLGLHCHRVAGGDRAFLHSRQFAYPAKAARALSVVSVGAEAYFTRPHTRLSVGHAQRHPRLAGNPFAQSLKVRRGPVPLAPQPTFVSISFKGKRQRLTSGGMIVCPVIIRAGLRRIGRFARALNRSLHTHEWGLWMNFSPFVHLSHA
jgi:hypothetical protein